MTEQPKKDNRFKVVKLEERIAPAIIQVNGGGHVPKGEANGIPATNPSGYAPPGHNKERPPPRAVGSKAGFGVGRSVRWKVRWASTFRVLSRLPEECCDEEV